MRRVAGVLAMVVALALVAGHAVGGPPLRVTMRLYGLSDGTPVLRGTRTVSSDEDAVHTIAQFADNSGALVRVAEGMYRRDTLAPLRYRVRDERRGHTTTVEREDGRLHVLHYFDGDATAHREAWLKVTPRTLISPAVAPYLLRNRRRLRGGETLHFRLVVASKARVVDFRARMTERSQGARRTVIVEPDGWFARQFVEPVRVVIADGPPPRVVELRGPSEIPTADGEEQALRTVFGYEAGVDRRLALLFGGSASAGPGERETHR